MRVVLFILLVARVSTAFSQQINLVSGIVRDSTTNEPLPFVNVFFANTAIGTSTNEKGEFELSGFGSGKYDLTLSFVGYRTQQHALNFSGSQYKVNLLLVQEYVRLSEVLVKADTAGWKRNFITFRENFIGSTANAGKATITNARSIHLYFDPTDRVLVAHAKPHLVIDNAALGYRVYYQLVDFFVDYKSNFMQYLGIPRFEALKPKNDLQLKKWEKERKRAYEGSFTNLVQLIYKQEIEQSKFKLFELHSVPNPERPSSEFLAKRINYWKSKLMSGGVINLSNRDSLSYYSRLRSLPEVIDSVGREMKASDLLKPGTSDIIHYKGRLKAVYKEREEPGYVVGKRRPPLKVQESTIHFTNDIRIYPNGYYEDVRSLIFEGYMGWAEKIADMLPYDYKPGEK